MSERKYSSGPRWPQGASLVALSLVICATLTSCALLDRIARAPAGGIHPGSPSLTPTPAPIPSDCSVSDLLVPSCGAWWGVTPGAFTPAQGARALDEFESKIGRPVDIYHAYYRAPDLFPTSEDIAIATEPGPRRLLFLNWKPEMGRTWAEIAAGDPVVDRQIDRLSEHIKENYPHPFFLTIHHEPEDEVIPKPGSGFTAKDYRAMFRYVVKRLRDNGVGNAVIVMNYMGAPNWAVQPWFGELYPGDDVVDWISYDPYAEQGTETFAELVNLSYPPWLEEWKGFYRWVGRVHPGKPLMLSEWGVTAYRDDRSHQPGVFRSMIEHVRQYPEIKAYVYFSAPESPKGDTTVDATAEALSTYRKLSNLPYLDPRVPEYAEKAEKAEKS